MTINVFIIYPKVVSINSSSGFLKDSFFCPVLVTDCGQEDEPSAMSKIKCLL